MPGRSSDELEVWLWTLMSVALVGAVSLVGLLALVTGRARAQQLARLLVSLAVGSLLGDAFIHLVPESFERHGMSALGTSLLVLAGMLLFFVVEKLIRHHHPGADTAGSESATGMQRPALLTINVMGDSIHNFIDGVLVAASYLVSPTLGLSTTLAVIFHELPQELADFAVQLHAGLSIRKAVALNLASAGTAVLGAITTLLAGASAGESVSERLVPLTAGGFVYLAAADLIPELQRERSLSGLAAQVGLMSLGIAMMAALTWIE